MEYLALSCILMGWFVDSPNQKRINKNGGYNGIICATISDAFTTYVMYLAE